MEYRKKHKILLPFAWIYQFGRNLIKGFRRDDALNKFWTEFTTAQNRNALFDELGIKRSSKGIAIYKNGKYVRRWFG